jgi:lipoprotein-releasing system permease protein
MIEGIQGALGLVSATLVALIALGFGSMFLFFSGSAVLVLGQFLPFARRPVVALPALAAAAALALAAGLAFDLGPYPVWLLPVVWLGLGGAAYLLVLLPRLGRVVRWIAAAVLLASGLAFLGGMAFSALERAAQSGIFVALLIVNASLLGFGPLVVAGLIAHRGARPVEWFLALRYLVAERRQTFISVITVICVLGVALGVAVITVVLSVMNGFESIWHEKIFGNRAHFVIQSGLGPFADYDEVRARALEVEGVVGATPFVVTEAVLRGASGEIQAVLLKGVDPESVATTTRLVEDLVEGSLEAIPGRPGGEGVEARPGVIVGSEIADRFLLRVGDPLVLISPLGGAPTPLGPAPRLERFRVAGIFRADFFQFDESFVYTDLSAAQEFMRTDDVVTGVEVRTVDPYRSQVYGREVSERLGRFYYARDWKEFYPGFFQALKTEQALMFVLLSFIMVVAGFIIVATLIMMIMEESRDIAILKAMGCEDDGILRVFAIEGGLIGIGGLALGLGMGLVITWNLDRVQAVVERVVGYDVLPANIYQLGGLPFEIDPQQLLLIAVIALTFSVGATLLPSWRAARLDPAEALRYE